jgi:hypothetical protein
LRRQIARQDAQQDRLVVGLEIGENLREVLRGKFTKDFTKLVEVAFANQFHQLWHEQITDHAVTETESAPRRKTKAQGRLKVSFDPRAGAAQSIGVNRNLNLNLLISTLTGVAVGF